MRYFYPGNGWSEAAFEKPRLSKDLRKGEKMKKIFCCWLLISGVFMAASAVAADMPKAGCLYQGTWMSMEGSPILTTQFGESASSGTGTGEVFGPNSDPTLGGMYPDAVRISTLRGLWERRSGNTFAFTQIWYGLDAAANVLWIAKNSGISKMSNDCNQMTIADSTLELFSPEVNPFGGTPFFVETLPTFSLYRTRIDPPATITP